MACGAKRQGHLVTCMSCMRPSTPAIWQAASRENVRAGAAAEALSKQLVKAKVGWSTLFKH